MHRYRSAAKRAAWYDGEDEPGAYNPFRKFSPRRRNALYELEPAEFRVAQPSAGTYNLPRSSTPLPETANGDESPILEVLEPDSPVGEKIAEKKESTGHLRIMDHMGVLEKRDKEVKFTIKTQIRATILNSWFNVLFVLVPVGFIVNYLHLNPIAVFVVNFVAIVPSSTMLSYALEELMLRVGDTVGGLLSITFSNAVQLISSVLLLKARQLRVLQTCLLGNILSNLLLTTGLAFLIGGYNRIEQYFNVAIARTISMLLLLAVLSIVIPTCSRLLADTSPAGIQALSRGTAVVIIISYILWLFFQLRTHRAVIYAPAPKSEKKGPRPTQRREVSKHFAAMGASLATSGTLVKDYSVIQDWEEEPKPVLTVYVALFTLVFSTVLVGFNTEFATNSIQGPLSNLGISQTFLGLVILPLISLEPSSIHSAKMDKMGLTVALTLERCMQTALMVVPLTVLLAWCMDINMTLEFDGFSVTSLFTSIIIVTHVVQEGKSNWLTGALLVKVYFIIALASFFIHET